MTPESLVDEIRTRLQLSLGAPTLLFGVTESDAALPEVRRLLLQILRAPPSEDPPLQVADLGYTPSAVGPATWTEEMQGSGASAFVLSFVADNPLSTRAFARVLNAERELLRKLPGPLLLFLSRDVERDLRRHAPDFFTWVARAYELPAPRDLAPLAEKLLPAPAPSAKAAAPESPIRFLHLSDIHLRPQRVKKYDQDRVLDGLIQLLARRPASEPLDLVFLTGDLAQSGRPEEYDLVTDLLQKLLAVTNVPPERVFSVPGNHDLDRDTGRFLLRTLTRDEDAIAFFVEAKSRVFHEQKFAAYKKGLGAVLGEKRPHGLGVGADAVEIVEIRGERLAVATFNSAWFAQGDDDQGKLWLGEPGVAGALDRIGDSDVSFAIAMMHHPFDHLHELERDVVERWFERGFDLVLRGHLHANKTRSIASQRGGFVEVAGPSAYQGSQWPNGCFLGEIRPRARKIRLCPLMYSSGPDPWVKDPKVFPDDEKDGYCHDFVVPEKRRLPSSVARPLRDATRLAVQTASREQRAVIAQTLEWNTGLAGPTRSALNILSDTPELLTEVLGKDRGALALVQAITNEGQRPEWQSRRVTLSAPDALETALLGAGELFAKIAASERARWSEADILVGLHAALSALIAGAPVSLGRDPSYESLGPDIVIGPRESADAIIAVKRAAGTKLARERARDLGLTALDDHLRAQGAPRGALVVSSGALLPGTAPSIERARTPEGRDVLVLTL